MCVPIDLSGGFNCRHAPGTGMKSLWAELPPWAVRQVVRHALEHPKPG